MNKKIIEALKRVIEENSKTMLAVVKILNDISERLATHENRAHELEYKLESITDSLEDAIEDYCVLVTEELVYAQCLKQTTVKDFIPLP